MKNIKKVIYAVIILVIAILFAMFSKHYLKIKQNTPINDTITNESSSLNFTKAIVTKVIDGDTIWVNIDGKEEKVRLIGINCPEYTSKIEPYGKESTEYTTNELNGKTVYLQKDITDTDSYNRLLRYVWLEQVNEINDTTISNYLFNAKLVINGYAQSNYYKPNITLQKYLEEYEKEAKNQKIGMWQ